METRNEEANRWHLVDLIPKVGIPSIFYYNKLVDLIEREEMWVGLIPKVGIPSIFYYHKDTRNEEANRCHLVDLIEREEMWVGLIPKVGIPSIFYYHKDTRNEGANRCHLVDLIEREEMDTRNEGANRCHLVDLIEREEMETRNGGANRYHAILYAVTIEVKMIFGKQEVHFSNRRSCHGTKLLKSSLSLAPFFLPSAGGTGHGSGQPEHQSHSEIYPSTLNVVSNCPSRGEYMQRSLAKCADVCGSYMQDGNCAYHCMRDSSKTKLVEFCAKPKPLFVFCPEYDPVDQTIQKDLATLCNSTFSRNYYNSSDIYFCDPNNCLQLRESSVHSGATTLTTLMSETTEMNDGDSKEWFLPLFIILPALLAVIMIGYILFRVFFMRGIVSAHNRKMTENRNQNGNQYACKEEMITLG